MANEQTSVPLFASGEVLTAANMNLSAGTGVPVFATTTTRDAAFGGTGEKVLEEGQLCYLSDSNIVQYYTGAAWATVGPNVTQQAIFSEQQASGTNGGTFTAGSYVKRVLNTTNVNTITGCSLASSVITLTAGTYTIIGQAPGYKVDRHKIRLQNTTATSTIELGCTSQSENATNNMTWSFVQSTLTITGSTTIELQHRCITTNATVGLGLNDGFGDNEVYAQIWITRIA